MRLFIAAQLSDETKRSVKAVQDSFRKQKVSGNYTPQENLHITLAFIGEYDDPEHVADVLAAVSFREFSVTMDRVGCFGDLWWTGFAEIGELDSLAGKVRRALAEGNIPFDRKRFKPHVTILRKPEFYGGSVPKVEIEPATMNITGISLMKSFRGRNGMIYTELAYVSAHNNDE